ncbi:AcrR family transcriptional regulator [Variovorax boronicumulans]|uniref:TetR/AcrR family transcriptional regulator n=1 Tax=Variovorax boronicumulans TaxID=436515 RepID=UPI0027827CB5|nr:TetR/AcrR family transcriptional regulator [Variovorax boronicumulans]MDQ0036606.1 AcrR family transcriptional regulator [Variovorax boronicumulans]MDQ0074293.1 AcrR family transcriptional regulator [Variovorax boronicumulans]
MDAKTQKSELTRAAIVGAALDLALAEGLEAISLQVIASRLGLSKSGVFSRVGSREALQKAVIEEYGRGFLADVFVPAMQKPKGLARLNDIVARWIARTRDVEAQTGCLYVAGAFEFDDREGELRDVLLGEITRWRAALRRTVTLAIEAGELKADTEPAQLVSEINGIMMNQLHDARFLRDPHTADRAAQTWQRLLSSYLA